MSKLDFMFEAKFEVLNYLDPLTLFEQNKHFDQYTAVNLR